MPIASTARDAALGLVVIALFSSWPLLNFANRNRERLDVFGVESLLLVLASAFVAAAVCFLLACRVTRWRRVPSLALATAALLTFFFNHHGIADELGDALSALGIDAGANLAYFALAAVATWAALAFGSRRVVLDVLVVFGFVANLIPGVGLAVFAITPEPDLGASLAPPALEFGATPNIFHLVADSYPRQDSALRFLGHDNTEFVEALGQRKFFVAAESYSNYPATFLSLASTLSMELLVTEETGRFKSMGARFRPIIAGESPVVALLREHGYRHVQQGSGGTDLSRCGAGVDLCLSSGRSALVQTVLDLTPLSLVTEMAPFSTPADFGEHLDQVFALDGPVFAFVHAGPPHPPRQFAAGCRRETEAVPAADFWRDRESYVHDIVCVNAQLLELVDAILARDPDAVILLHGDHGSAFGVDWSLPIDGWSSAQVEERFSILMAVRLPDRCRSLLYPSLSPVNLYPVVFACLAEVEPELRPDRLYISPKPSHADWGLAHRVRSRREAPSP